MTTHRLIAVGTIAGLLMSSVVEAGPRGGGQRPQGGRGAIAGATSGSGTTSSTGTTRGTRPNGGAGANAGGAGRQCSGLAGSVTSVDTTALTFVLQPRGNGAAVTVTTTAETQFVKSDGTAGTLADVVVGAQVKVEGTSTGTDAVTATKVTIGGAAGGGSGSGVVTGTGTVSNVDPDALSFVAQPQRSSLPSFVVTTTAETQFKKSDGSAATFADVVTGAEVCAQGTLTGTDSIAATRVLIKVATTTTSGTRRR